MINDKITMFNQAAAVSISSLHEEKFPPTNSLNFMHERIWRASSGVRCSLANRWHVRDVSSAMSLRAAISISSSTVRFMGF